MGFFSSLLKIVAPVAGAFLGVQAATGQVTAQAVPRTLPTVTGDTSGLSVMAQQRVAAGTVVARGSVSRAEALAMESRGRLRKRTIVQTFDPVTGAVTSVQTFPGGVAVRSSDVAAARRVFRQIRKLDAKLPRKTVKQSQVKQLTDRVIKNALERAGDDPDCPK